MPSETLTAAADRLDSLARDFAADPTADFSLSRELVELAARLRNVARWLARPRPERAAAPESEEPRPKWITRAEAAELLGVSVRTIARLNGELQRYPGRAKEARYWRDEVEALAGRSKTESRSDEK